MTPIAIAAKSLSHDAITMLYLLIALFAGPLVISLLIRGRFQSVYEAAREVKGTPGLTGAGVARKILQKKGITDVDIIEHWGLLPDYYDPVKRQLRLSAPHFRGSNAAAYGIAAHEAGHVLQHHADFKPLQMRISAIKVSQYASPLVFLLPVVAVLVRAVSGKIAITVMFASWALVLGYNLASLPVEFDATERSREVIDRMRLFPDRDEEKAVVRMMRAAPFMYVSGFLNTVKWLISCLIPGRKG